VRERDIIFGLFNFYDLLIEKYKEKYNIKKKIDNETKLFQRLVNKGELSEKDVALVKSSEVIQNVDFEKVVKKEKTKEEEKKMNKSYYL
jgi:hypothetical protein